jgi:hypothetical protein
MTAVGTPGITLRQGALTAGFGLLVMAAMAPFAELYVFPKLVVWSDADQTVRNITENRGLFLAAFFGYFITFLCDIVVAWGLWVLLRPVNAAVSLLAAWMRLVYAGIALMASLKLVTVVRLTSVRPVDYLEAGQISAQVMLLCGAFQREWGMSLVLFGIYLGVLGLLVYRSGYIPKVMGVLLVIAGAGYVLDSLRPYLFPGVDLGFLMITFFGEAVFMLWLLVRGRKLEER